MKVGVQQRTARDWTLASAGVFVCDRGEDALTSAPAVLTDADVLARAPAPSL